MVGTSVLPSYNPSRPFPTDTPKTLDVPLTLADGARECGGEGPTGWEGRPPSADSLAF